jgi:very-short-patch-repair endonuclease
LAGVASHTSAAALHGWQLATQPERPCVVVPRQRKVPPHRRRGVELRWRDLQPDEVDGLVTSPLRTVLDCARDLPFADALAVADSALRHRNVDHDRLVELAHALPSTGRTQAIRVAGAATPLAANPFESVLRALALDVPGLDLQPQVVIEEDGFRCRPDLVDTARRLVVEADSFEWHGGRAALTRDCVRYNALVLRGWTVLRFAWEHVMLDRGYVRACLGAVVRAPAGRAALPPRRLLSA